MKDFLLTYRIEVVAFLACFMLVSLVFELVRRKQIKEKYSFLWFMTGISLIILTLKRDWLEKFAKLVGIYYPPSALFLVLSFFIILILIHYSMVLSRLMSQNQKLAQKLALLEAELKENKAHPPKDLQPERAQEAQATSGDENPTQYDDKRKAA